VIETRAGDQRLEGIPSLPNATMRWVVCVDPTPGEIDELAAAFDMHPLVVEDIQTRNQRPKVDEYEDRHQIFVVLFAAVRQADGRHVTLQEVHVLVGPDYVVTITDTEIPALAALASLCGRRDDILARGPGKLFYRLCDAVVDSYFPILDDMDATIDDLETSIIERADQSTVREIFDVKRELNVLRRVLGPQRDLLQGLAGPHGPLLGEEAQLYLRDVYDHGVRIVEQVDSYRDIVTSALDVYLSSVSNRLGEQTRRLSVIATIFLPLTFFTGFFGQNFGFLVNAIQSREAFVVGLSAEIVSIACIWYAVRRATMGARPLPDERRRRPGLTVGLPRMRRPASSSAAAAAHRGEKKQHGTA
jgi:magnesium transporter